MENGIGARNHGPVALTPPPTIAFKTKTAQPEVAGRVSCARSATAEVHLVCTNPGCTVATWMGADDWEARVTSARRQQRRGWNGDEDDWLPPDRDGSTAAAAGGAYPEQLACPCGRGWQRRATMPSMSSPAVVAARLERQHQLRLMRRSEPMLAAPGPSQLSALWTGRHHQWPFTPSDADGSLWTSRPAAAHFRGFCPQAISAEHFRPENSAAISSRHRVFSEPETYEPASQHVTAGTNGYVYPGKMQPSQLLKLQAAAHLAGPSTPELCNGNRHQHGGCSSVQANGQIYAGHECGAGRQRSATGLTPRRPSRSAETEAAVSSSVNGRDLVPRPAVDRRDGASPDSMSSDSGSSAASTGSASGRSKAPPAATGPTAGRQSTATSRGNIFRQRTAAELAAFRALSVHCNAYEVQTAGDDAPYGKDRLRTHVLVALSAARRATVDCVVCGAQMAVYHDFPLLDGLFFESPMRYNSDVRVEPLTVGGLHRHPLSDACKFYLNAVCFNCVQVYTAKVCIIYRENSCSI